MHKPPVMADAERRSTSTFVRGYPSGDFVKHMLIEAEEHGAFVEQTEEGWFCRTAIGDIVLKLGGAAASLTVLSDTPERLHMLRDTVMGLVAGLSPELAQGLVWSGEAMSGLAPPNFRRVRAISAHRLSPSFYRVRLEGEDLAVFARTGLHFRLVLPPKGLVAPQWPTVGENGQTVWPEGEAALHRPVYTTRWIDPEAGLLDFDVFIHEGGRTSDWAAALVDCDESRAEVGIIGPGGGWIPEQRRLLLAGDETALPAIARILEGLPAEAEGVAHILAATKGDHAVLETQSRVEPRWRFRDEGAPSLCETVMADDPPKGEDALVWFAGEKAEARRLRDHLRDTVGVDKAGFRAAGYWSAD